MRREFGECVVSEKENTVSDIYPSKLTDLTAYFTAGLAWNWRQSEIQNESLTMRFYSRMMSGNNSLRIVGAIDVPYL